MKTKDNDASGILFKAVLESMAEYYRQEHSAKIKKGIALKKQKQAEVAK